MLLLGLRVAIEVFGSSNDEDGGVGDARIRPDVGEDY